VGRQHRRLPRAANTLAPPLGLFSDYAAAAPSDSLILCAVYGLNLTN